MYQSVSNFNYNSIKLIKWIYWQSLLIGHYRDDWKWSGKEWATGLGN